MKTSRVRSRAGRPKAAPRGASAESPLRAALRRAADDPTTDPAVRLWLRRLLAGGAREVRAAKRE